MEFLPHLMKSEYIPINVIYRVLILYPYKYIPTSETELVMDQENNSVHVAMM